MQVWESLTKIGLGVPKKRWLYTEYIKVKGNNMNIEECVQNYPCRTGRVWGLSEIICSKGDYLEARAGIVSMLK